MDHINNQNYKNFENFGTLRSYKRNTKIEETKREITIQISKQQGDQRGLQHESQKRIMAERT